MHQAPFPHSPRALAGLALLTLLALGATPAAQAADPTPTPAPGASRQTTSTQHAPLPRGLVIGLAGLAGAGTLVGLGVASASVRERDEEAYDQFIERAPR